MTTANQAESKGRRVSIDLTPAAAREVDRLCELTDLSTADLFRHALQLIRLYVGAKQDGKEFAIVDPTDTQRRSQIELPLLLNYPSGS